MAQVDLYTRIDTSKRLSFLPLSLSFPLRFSLPLPLRFSLPLPPRFSLPLPLPFPHAKVVAGSSVNPRLEVRADVAPGPGNAVAASSRVMQGLVRLARPASEGPLAYLLGLSGSTGS